MNNLVSLVGGAVVAVFGLIGFYLWSKRKGKQEAKQEAIQETLKVMTDVKKTSDTVNAMPSDSVRSELRKFTCD